MYRSQFGQEGKDGYNIALFELEDAEILNCAPYQVESIEVNYKEVGDRWFARTRCIPRRRGRGRRLIHPGRNFLEPGLFGSHSGYEAGEG